MKEEFFEGKDGVAIHFRTWRGPGPANAVIVAVHGFKAHGGLFAWAGGELSRRRFAVYSIDLRGHGKSEGERLWVEDANDYVDDVRRLIALARAREPGVPVFLLGHSAGGVVSCVYALDHQSEIDGLICHSFANELPAPDLALTVLKGLSHIAPHARLLKLDDDLFSRDPAFVTAMKTDPLIPREGYPSQTVAAMIRIDERLTREFSSIELPVLIIHGTEDGVTKPHGSQVFHERASSTDKTLKLYEGHYHDLLNDVGREHVLADIVAWLEARLPKSKPLALGG